MIVQYILDFFSQAIATLLDQLPSLPVQFNEELIQMTSFGSAIGAQAAKFGTLVPFPVIFNAMSVWIALVAFWLAGMAIKVILWGFGRRGD